MSTHFATHFALSGDSGPVCGMPLSDGVYTTTTTSEWFRATERCQDCLAYIADAACHRSDNVNMHLITEMVEGSDEWRTLCGLLTARSAITARIPHWLSAPSRCDECVIVMEKMR